MENLNEITSKLNDALEKNYDAIKGYRNAADQVNNQELKTFFNDQVAERRNFATQLSGEITALGGEPVTDGSLSGSVHRSWMNITNALSTDKEENVIEECIRGEKAAKNEYQEILESNLPKASNLSTIISLHQQEIDQAVNKLHALEQKF